MRVTKSTMLSGVSDERLRGTLEGLLNNIMHVINGNLELSNLSGVVREVDFHKANEDITVNHSLGRKPQFYLLVGSTEPLQVYDGQNFTTTSVIHLRSSAIGKARVFII